MARACDRCSRLKTQCNGDRPCNRCERLALDCTQTRPVLAKGRPKRETIEPRSRRASHTSHQIHSPSTSPRACTIDVLSYPPASECSRDLVHSLPDLPLPEPIAAYLLDLVFLPVSSIGLLEVFSHAYPQSFQRHGTNPLSAKRTKLSHQSHPDSKALLYTLIVVAANLCNLRDTSINLSSLQQCAINSIPALCDNSRELRVEDALSLCYLSYTYCMSSASVKVAARWAVLATTIAREAQEIEDDHQLMEFHKYALWAIHINDRIISLLHYRLPTEKTVKIPRRSQKTKDSRAELGTFDKMSIVGVLESPITDLQSRIDTDYFSLYLPLLVPLDIALEEPQAGSSRWNKALTELDQYYLDFPQSLKTYNDITILYQVEVTIWYHGIHLLLYGKRDFYDCLDDVTWSTSASFLRCVEHAQLAGEAIPTLAHLMRTSNELSPASIYFILLSAVIHGVALRKCMENDRLPATSHHAAQLNPSGWTKLIENTHLHLFFLRKIRETSTACTIELLHDIECVLQPIYIAATSSSRIDSGDMDISRLKSYRWTGQGRGIVKVSPKLADEISASRTVTALRNEDTNVEKSDAVKNSILAMFNVHSRNTSPGQFSRNLMGKI